jgi:hypothetical protein
VAGKHRRVIQGDSGGKVYILGGDSIEHCKGKAMPLQALIGPEGSRRLKPPDFEKIGT